MRENTFKMKIIIPHAHIINPDEFFRADICIENGKISSLESPGTLLDTEDAKIVQTGGVFVLPGSIDPHVHLSLETPAGLSADDILSGSDAALAGGVTHIMDFVTPLRGQSLTKALEKKISETQYYASVGLSFHMGISGWLPDMEQQMEICVKEYGIKSFKVYLAYRENIGIGYEELEKIMKISARLGTILLVHAEEHEMIENLQKEFLEKGQTEPKYHALSRPPKSESTAIKKVINLVKETHCKTYFVHISSAESAHLIAEAKKESLPVYAETCPQYLIFDDSVYEGSFEKTAPYVFSPPVRPKQHRELLWQHLHDGTFDTIATDHCPFTMEQKMAGRDNFTLIPNGAGGLEFRVPLLFHYAVLQEKFSLQQWIKLCTSNAAEIFGLKEEGKIAPGADANIVFFNPVKQNTLTAAKQAQQCDINIYEGLTVRGHVEKVFYKGEKVII